MSDKEQKLIIPQRLWKDKRFAPIERMILSYRLGFKDFFASNEFVANEFGVDKRTVRRTYEKGKKYGFIDCNKELPNDDSNNSVQKGGQNCPSKWTKLSKGVDNSVQEGGQNCPPKTQDLPMKTDLLYNRYSGSSPSGSLPEINKIDYKEQGTGQQEQYSEPDIINQFIKKLELKLNYPEAALVYLATTESKDKISPDKIKAIDRIFQGLDTRIKAKITATKGTYFYENFTELICSYKLTKN